MRILTAVLFALMGSAPALGQAGAAAAPRTLAGRCGATNWACVAQCIDRTCVDRCLADVCEKALNSLVRCAERSGCGPDDSVCSAKACGRQCEKSFEPAGRTPERETLNPCADPALGKGRVPRELVGRWSLEAASISAEDREKLAAQEGKDVKPRPDYERLLEVTPDGCFLLETNLEDATLGRGNQLAVRAWGAFEVDEKQKAVSLQPQDGQAVGPVCGKDRAIPVPKEKLQSGTYAFDVEGEVLTLTRKDASKQTFQFRRAPPAP